MVTSQGECSGWKGWCSSISTRSSIARCHPVPGPPSSGRGRRDRSPGPRPMTDAPGVATGRRDASRGGGRRRRQALEPLEQRAHASGSRSRTTSPPTVMRRVASWPTRHMTASTGLRRSLVVIGGSPASNGGPTCRPRSGRMSRQAAPDRVSPNSARCPKIFQTG